MEYRVNADVDSVMLTSSLQNDTLHHDTADKFNVIFCFFVSAMFGFSTSVLFFFHLYLIAVNKTTIGTPFGVLLLEHNHRRNGVCTNMSPAAFHSPENMQSPFVAGVPVRKAYYIGWKRNIQQVFGRSCLLAFLPVATRCVIYL